MKKTLIELAQALFLGVITFVLTVFQVFAPLDSMVKDAAYQSLQPLNKKIKIIAIDDKTLQKYGVFGTWSRQTYADLVNKLNEYGDISPSVIAFDICFFSPLDEEGDTAFAEAAKNSGNVIVASQIVYEPAIKVDSNGNQYLDQFNISEVQYPYEALRDVTYQGYVNIAADGDSTVRRTSPYAVYDNSVSSSFAATIFECYNEKESGNYNSSIPTDKNGNVMIRYAGAPGDYEVTSMCDILDGTVDVRNFANSIVLVGAYAEGMQDAMYVPTGGSEQMYGVEVHANILQCYIDGDFPVQANRVVCALVTGLLVALIYFILGRIRLLSATIISVVSVGAELFTGIFLSGNGLIIDIIYILIMTLLVYIIVVIKKYFIETIKKRKVLNAFKKYVDPEIVAEISKRGDDFKIELGGESRNIAVLFVDIRGFTALSECLTPEEVVTVLNKYLYLTTHSILNNGGTLDKFVGDATMAIFNAPFPLEDYIFKAVCAAVDIANGDKEFNEKLHENISEESLKKLRERWKERGDDGVGFGVGVHCGEAVVGNIGCDFRMDYTAIGDTVNTAARIESGAKKAQVLISEDVYKAIGDRVVINGIEEKNFKNKAEPVKCYSVEKIITDKKECKV